MEKDKAIKIGLIVVLLGVILIWGINFCKGKNIFTKENLYYSTYNQVEGLQKNSAILLRGHKIGHVKDIYFTSSEYKSLTVELSIYSDIKLPKSTIARIFSSDILGSKAIDIILPSPIISEEGYIENMDTIQSEIETSITDQVRIEVAPLKKQAEKLLESASIAIDQVKYVLNESNGEEVKKCFIKLQKAIDAIHHSGVTLDTILTNGNSNIQGILTNINGITKNIDNHSEEIGSVIKSVSSISDSLSKANITETFNELQNAVTELDSILKKVNNGNNSIGELVNNKELYDNLNDASVQLNDLLKDVQKNPKRYVSFPIFGSSKEKNKTQKEQE